MPIKYDSEKSKLVVEVLRQAMGDERLKEHTVPEIIGGVAGFVEGFVQLLTKKVGPEAGLLAATLISLSTEVGRGGKDVSQKIIAEMEKILQTKSTQDEDKDEAPFH